MTITTDTRKWIWIGAIEGAKCSLGLAFAFALWFVFSERIALSHIPTLIVEWVTNAPNTQYTPQSYGAYLLQSLAEMPMSLLSNSGMGGIPALAVGILSGVGLAWLLAHNSSAPYAKSRLIVGAAFGISVTLVFNIVAYIVSEGARDLALYLLFVVIPSLLYIAVCLWLSHRIPMLVERAHAKEFAVRPAPVG